MSASTKPPGELKPGPPFIEAMMQTGFYPHPCDQIEVRQTKTSWVLLAGDFVYKIKKPVHFPFVDSTTRTKRYRLCHAELRLNRRLAPEVYYCVAGISEKEGVYELIPDAKLRQAGVLDFAVVMRRLPDEQMLERMVAVGTAGTESIRAVAEKMAAFHARAPSDKSQMWGSAEAISRLVTSNLGEATELAADSLARTQLAAVREYSRRYVASHRQFLDNRQRDGHVRDAHGDLRCDSICFAPEGLAIFDCVEYNERLRYADSASEVASLATDLDLLGRSDLAEQLVKAYVEASNDLELPSLLPFYKCYRATLRGKLETLTCLQLELPLEHRLLARGTASRCFGLAETYTAGSATA